MRQWLKRANRYFAIDWRVIPFQPVLFLFLFIGALMVLTLDVNHPAFGRGDMTFFWWITLSIACPPLAFTSWLLIRRFPGRPRYFGYWARFGADVGQLFSLSAFLAAISDTIDPIAGEIYATQVFASAWAFLILLIVRDVWKLIATERLANRIHKAQQ